MTNSGDNSALIELHKLMDHGCDGQAMALYERIQDQHDPAYPVAEVIKLPGLHERSTSHNQRLASGLRRHMETADVIAFPRPQWLRNADRRKS